MLTGALFMLEIYDRVLPSRQRTDTGRVVVPGDGTLCGAGIIDAIRSRILVRVGKASTSR